MGKRVKDALKVDFDPKLKLEFHGTKVTSDAGLLTYREKDFNMVAIRGRLLYYHRIGRLGCVAKRLIWEISV